MKCAAAASVFACVRTGTHARACARARQYSLAHVRMCAEERAGERCMAGKDTVFLFIFTMILCVFCEVT